MRQLAVVIATWVLIYLIPLVGVTLAHKIADLKYRHPAVTVISVLVGFISFLISLIFLYLLSMGSAVYDW